LAQRILALGARCAMLHTMGAFCSAVGVM
jgi:hypothetical protein